jgi:hypothetical protein
VEIRAGDAEAPRPRTTLPLGSNPSRSWSAWAGRFAAPRYLGIPNASLEIAYAGIRAPAYVPVPVPDPATVVKEAWYAW